MTSSLEGNAGETTAAHFCVPALSLGVNEVSPTQRHDLY